MTHGFDCNDLAHLSGVRYSHNAASARMLVGGDRSPDASPFVGKSAGVSVSRIDVHLRCAVAMRRGDALLGQLTRKARQAADESLCASRNGHSITLREF